jgi:hypothetical protein
MASYDAASDIWQALSGGVGCVSGHCQRRRVRIRRLWWGQTYTTSPSHIPHFRSSCVESDNILRRHTNHLASSPATCQTLVC